MAKPASLATILHQLPQTTVESIWLGALLASHFTGDEEAERLLEELEAYRAFTLEASAKLVPAEAATGKAIAASVDGEALRQALLHESKLKISYRDRSSRATERVVWPLDIAHYGPNGSMYCWCEKRRDFRNFRFDRITQVTVLSEKTGVPRSVMKAFAEIVDENNLD